MEDQTLPTVYQNDTTSLILNTDSFGAMERVADLMASSKIQIPKHLQGNPADCFAVVMQSMQWGMNPFVIAQKTHLSPGGQLGYEAQLVNAVAIASGAFAEEPEFDFIGDWGKILGNVVEKQGKSGGKDYVHGWKASDEAGLGVVCSAPMGKEGKVRKLTLMLSQCWPRFSTQWATDPQQQITYAAVKKMCRRYAPGAILGVYTSDELAESVPVEKDITPHKAHAKPTTEDELPPYPDDRFNKNLTSWDGLVKSGKKTVDSIIKTISSKHTLTSEQLHKIKTLGAVDAEIDDGCVEDDEFMNGLGDV